MPRQLRSNAVALRYDPQAPFHDLAPRLVARGEGLLADRILELARQHGIPIEQNPDLLAALAHAPGAIPAVIAVFGPTNVPSPIERYRSL